VKNAYLRAICAAVTETEPKGETSESARKRIPSVGEDCPVLVLVKVVLISSCYEEMSSADEKQGSLVYEDTLAGCGKRKEPLHLKLMHSSASRVFCHVGDEHGRCWRHFALPTESQANKGDVLTCV
jgi:hypothetical protein